MNSKSKKKWNGIDINLFNIDYLQQEIKKCQEQIIKNEKNIKEIKADIASPYKQTSPLDYNAMQTIADSSKASLTAIDVLKSQISSVKEVIHEFQTNPKETLQRYQSELKCSQEYIFELIKEIPQLKSVYELLNSQN
ncbi:hypothetical protein [Microscilla marina]|uniref:Uncharacterized protein n=1 Tax=Microscilla marina ATCC 23134 TaxID=313606 RepID=A2A053_MICM2|nr:hypothetical protein [Microscilla marina]EAY23991.1 conserved hypothetical protein [Microscilla marina ATCC 23134]